MHLVEIGPPNALIAIAILAPIAIAILAPIAIAIFDPISMPPRPLGQHPFDPSEGRFRLEIGAEISGLLV